MRWPATNRMVLVAAVLAVLGLLGWFVIERNRSPEVDVEQVRAVLPLIDDQLRRGLWPGLLTDTRPDLKPQWFCEREVVETRRDGAELRIGLATWCMEYGRADGALIAGSGERSPKLAVLAGGPDGWEVIRIESPPDGHASVDWERRHFSPAAIKRLHHWTDGSSALSRDIAAQARLVFGLPFDAPVREP